MSNNYRMSYFMPPIAPIKDKQGRLMTPPTLIPFCEVSIEQVFQMITCKKCDVCSMTILSYNLYSPLSAPADWV